VLVTTRAGRFPYWYCPVHTPATLRGHELSVTDLGLNVQLFADGRYSVGGREEFEADSPSVTPEERGAAQSAVDQIVQSIKQGVAPFPKPR
jgi:protein associated with RNAse G/E